MIEKSKNKMIADAPKNKAEKRKTRNKKIKNTTKS